MFAPRPFLFALLAGLAALAADRVDLNGEWQMRIGQDVETVRVPHTWNVGKHADYEGTARYSRTFAIPAGAAGKHVELHFDATFYQSRVTLNGTEIGGHEGGHTAYWFDVTSRLRPVNVLEVEIDNRPGIATIPGYSMSLRSGDNVWYDWWHYGGIVRDVYLVVSDPLVVRRQQIRSRIANNAATVTDRVFLENFGPAADVTLRIEAVAPDGRVVGSAEKQHRAAAGKTDVEIQFRVENPTLWHFDRPNVYKVRAEARGHEAIEDTYGFRTFEIRDRKLYVNGERVRLSGMTRHEESPTEGLAETRGTMLRDYNEMKELQVTLTRPVHYPQHPFILDFADRNGILLIPEIPMWQFSEQQMQDPRVISLAQRMMTEMIEQAYNHPAIFGWSVCNESETNKPGGRRYFEILYETVKKLDPDRYVSYADSHIAEGTDPKINAAAIADFVMMNQYYGTWSGPEELLYPGLARAGRDYPDKMIIISEFGAAGHFRPDKVSGDELRVHIIRDQMEAFRKYDFIGGAIFWCYQDYKSHRNLRPGERSGMVEMGLVDENRQRYPSFNVWKQENDPAQVDLHWTFETGRPAGFRATVSRRPETALPTYSLHGYRAEWEVRDATGTLVAHGGKQMPDIGPDITVEGGWPGVASRGYTLTLRLVRPTGFTASERSLRWWEGLSGGDTVQDMEKRGYRVPEH